MTNKESQLNIAKMQSVIESERVEALIPHSPPMVLVDRIISVNEQSLLAEIDIEENCKFYDQANRGVPSWVGVEYMAQVIAAFAGVKAKSENEPIKLGFLLGTRKFLMPKPFLDAGKTYQIAVNELYLDDTGLASFDCQISCQDEVYATAKLNVFETDNAKQIIEK